MPLVYFDASALIKRYAPEPGTPAVNKAFETSGADRRTCCSITIPEVI